MVHRMEKARATRRQADEDLMEDAEAVNLAADWADISQGLRKDLGHQLHSQWIKPIQVGTINKETGVLDLFLPTEFSANWVNDRFHDRLQLAWSIARSEVRSIKIQVHPGRRQLPDLRLDDGRRPANDGASAIAVAAGTIGDAGFTSSVGLDPSLTFAAFVTGEANVLACNAAQRMAATVQQVRLALTGRRSISRPRPVRARRTCCTPSATPSCRLTRVHAFSTARQSGSWSNSFRRSKATR